MVLVVGTAVRSVRTSATDLSRHRQQVWQDTGDSAPMLKSGHVQGPPRPHRPAPRPADPAEVAARYGVHRSWVYKLKARYETDGEAAFEPRSRRPKTSPTAIPPATVTLITELRDTLTTAGLDAGPDTIAWHLRHHRRR